MTTSEQDEAERLGAIDAHFDYMSKLDLSPLKARLAKQTSDSSPSPSMPAADPDSDSVVSSIEAASVIAGEGADTLSNFVTTRNATPEVIEVSDQASVRTTADGSPHTSDTIEILDSYTPSLKRRRPSSLSEIMRRNRPRPAPAWVRRENLEIIDLSEIGDESPEPEVQVVSELPPAAAQRSKEIEHLKRQHREAVIASRRQQDRHSSEHSGSFFEDSFEASPGQSRSPYVTRQHASDTTRQVGSFTQPIDLEDAVNVQGPSRAQHVNGQAIGSFQNGVYVPYRVQQPHTSQESRPAQAYQQAGPANDYAQYLHNLNDAQDNRPSHIFPRNLPMQSVGETLRNSLRSHLATLNQHLFTANAHDLNRMSFESLPYSSSRNQVNQYREAYMENQITSEDLQNLLANIRDTDIPPDKRVANPVGLTKSLMEHQRVGLTWLQTIEDGTSKGGILADAMGLGKTIQAISLMLTRPSTDCQRKTTLVVAPVALLRQWAREIRVMTFPTPSIYIHHGSKKLANSADITAFDVVLTSFSTIGYEEAAKTRHEEKLLEQPTLLTLPPNCPMLETKWYRVILDEAHFIKNKNTRSAKGCCNLDAVHRWALTGTPMQNSVEELYSLISFLRLKPYNDYRLFVRDIAKPLSHKDKNQLAIATKKLQALLTAIMLRRTKDSRIDGKTILQLPEKHDIVDDVTMGEVERARYNDLESGARKILERTMREDRGSTGTNMLVLLLKLRQTCDHPLLSGKDETEISVLSKSDGVELALQLSPEVVARVKTVATDGFECPVCFDVSTTGVTILVPCGHWYCGECVVQQLDNSRLNTDGEEPAKCPQCRNPFALRDCISFDKHFREAYGLERLVDPIKVDKLETDSETLVDAAESKLTLKDQIKSGFKNKGKGRADMSSAGSIALAEKLAEKYNLKISDFLPSAKIQMITSLCMDIRTNSPGDKTIVFSQFTSFLDLVEIPLRQAGVSFLRYDGSLNAEKRNEALIQFEESPLHNVILVSLKAGNVGLNLTCANHVILSEPFWNPYVEDQAVDRAHRIGQGKQVYVHRLIIKDSVESRVLEIQNAKRKLIEGAMDPTQSAAISKLGRREIAYLFGLNAR